MSKSILVVGGGHAGVQAVTSLRQAGFEGQLTLACEEPDVPYQRPPLSKSYLSGKQALPQILLRPKQFYADRKINLLLGRTVISIDSERKTATFDDNTEAAWDELILATGSKARKLQQIPGANLDAVFYLRTLANVDRIRSAMADCERVVIVGGGYIGLEVAAAMRQADKQVAVLEMEARILQRVTSPGMSAFYHRVHEKHGVAIHTETALASLAAEGKAISAIAADGRAFPADLVIVGIGVLPATELAAAAGIECDNGILVDERCRTSVAHVWAIGDCTNHPNKIFGRRMRLESVPNAMEQARVVAANLTNQDQVHHGVPWFWSDQYDLKLQMAGFSANADTEILRGREEDERFARFYWQDGVLKGVDSVNCPQEFMVCRKLLEQGTKVTPEQLADETLDLKSLL